MHVSFDLSKLSEIKNAVKKAVYDKLLAKVNNKTELEQKIPGVTDFVKETKLTE